MNENINQNSPSGSSGDFSFNINPEIIPEPKNNKVKAICYIAIFVIAAAIIALAAFMLLPSSPETAVAKAARGTIDSLFEGDSNSLSEILTSQASESNFSLSYKGSDYFDEYAGEYSSLLKNSGITSNFRYDPNKREAGGSLDASVAGMSVNLAEFYLDDSAVSGRISLIEKTWIKMGFENIFSNYNKSALAKKYGEIDYDEDFSITPFALVDEYALISIGSQKELLYTYLSSDREAFNALKENMTVEKSDETYTTDDGKDVPGYNIVLQGDDIANMIMDFQGYIEEQNDYSSVIETLLPLINMGGGSLTAEEIQEEINACYSDLFTAAAEEFSGSEYGLTVYIYKNKFVRTDITIESEGMEINVSVLLPSGSGKEDVSKIYIKASDLNSGYEADFTYETTDSSENKNANMALNSEPYNVSFNLDYSKSTAEYELKLDYNNSYYAGENISLTSEGTYEKTENSLSLAADDISITDGSGNIFISLGLSMDAAPLSQTIEKPAEGETVDLFTADEAEFNALKEEIKSGANSLYSMVGQFF